MQLRRIVLLFACAAVPLLADTFAGPSVPAVVLANSLPPGAARPRLGNTHYAVVDRASLVDVTAAVRRTLGRTYGVGVGIVTTGWNPRWDCEAFAMAWELELRARLMREWFHAPAGSAIRPACFMFAVRRGPGGHCLILVLTNEGPVVVDPVVGPVVLTPDEIASVYYVNP